MYYATLAGLIESLREAKTAANPARRLTVGIAPSPRDSSPTKSGIPHLPDRGRQHHHTLGHTKCFAAYGGNGDSLPGNDERCRPTTRRGERPGDDAYRRRHAARHPAIDSQLCGLWVG